jgi:hypothetical protein
VIDSENNYMLFKAIENNPKWFIFSRPSSQVFKKFQKLCALVVIALYYERASDSDMVS